MRGGFGPPDSIHATAASTTGSRPWSSASRVSSTRVSGSTPLPSIRAPDVDDDAGDRAIPEVRDGCREGLRHRREEDVEPDVPDVRSRKDLGMGLGDELRQVAEPHGGPTGWAPLDFDGRLAVSAVEEAE